PALHQFLEVRFRDRRRVASPWGGSWPRVLLEDLAGVLPSRPGTCEELSPLLLDLGDLPGDGVDLGHQLRPRPTGGPHLGDHRTGGFELGADIDHMLVAVGPGLPHLLHEPVDLQSGRSDRFLGFAALLLVFERDGLPGLDVLELLRLGAQLGDQGVLVFDGDRPGLLPELELGDLPLELLWVLPLATLEREHELAASDDRLFEILPGLLTPSAEFGEAFAQLPELVVEAFHLRLRHLAAVVEVLLLRGQGAHLADEAVPLVEERVEAVLELAEPVSFLPVLPLPLL